MGLRCFIAIDIPETIKKEIGELFETLIKYDADVKWVTAANLHLTLKFLGDTAETAIPQIQKALSTVVSSYKPFCIKIRGTGVFPNRKYPRVYWIGTEGAGILKNLKEEIENSMIHFGFGKEDRDFNPHLTIGRVRSLKGVINVVNELGAFQGKEFGVMNVDSIKIMRSELKPKGPEYTCLHEVRFGNA
jgi:RNA 2',3'-cyclic 3'-phosphodiesterase